MGLSLCLWGCGSEGESGSASGPADGQEPVSRDFFAMDTYMTVTAYGENAAEATEAAEAEVNRLDAMLSTGNADSEIARVNGGGGVDAAGGGELSEEAGALVEQGLALYEETGRKFDIAIYPIMDAWGFTDKDYRVPSDEELEKLLPLTDAAKVHYDAEKHSVSFDAEGMAIDLGGIAKGYTSSRIMEIYREHGVESGLVSLGGNVQVLGTKPDGSSWRVAVQDPGSSSGDEGDEADGGSAAEDGQVQYLGILEAVDTAVITSGAYERNFTQDGHLYHHIIDPATGKPADSGLKSVTIVSEDGTLADALSTSLYIMGKDAALEYWRAHADQFDCILMDDAGELYVTAPIAEQFSSDAYHVNVVE
ncbi:MAG: FAD:protein FMN transferase [Firmicutes bacterium]|nr:FAD:protein FMN transferase [Bacillota bacterium]